MPEGETGQVTLLRRGIRDVTSLVALRAVWMAYPPARVAEDLADVLLRLLDAELVHVQLPAEPESIAATATRSGDAAYARRVREAIGPLQAGGEFRLLTAPDPLQHERELCWVVIPLGDDPADVLIAASADPAFPTEIDRLVLALAPNVADVVLRRQADELLRAENSLLRGELEENLLMGSVVGTSSAIRAVMNAVDSVAPTDATVLITGETGTGKELIAREIHRRSLRAAGPLIAVNCAALPASLIASELFGHERGAFTGALQRRIGRIELAAKGTLFFDEIGELPPEMQVVLLRVLQERTFERVGGSQPLKADVRLIAATNSDLAKQVADGTFRADLFYRLNVFPIHVPPLRERREDIPLLVEHFTQIFAKRFGKKIARIPEAAMRELTRYSWPGNIRELENVLERAVILSRDTTLRINCSYFPKDVAPSGAALPGRVDELERAAIEEALHSTHGRIGGARGAAARLGLPATTLYSKMRKHRIHAARFKE